MPRGDGTGPQGQGPKTGKGLGQCNPKNGVFTPLGQNPMGFGKGRGRGKDQRSGRGSGWGSDPGAGRGSGNRGKSRR